MKTVNRKLCRLAALVSAMALASAVQAEPVLKGKAINEDNLIKALTPAPAEAGGDEPVRTRSIKVIRDNPSAKPGDTAVKHAAKKASASLLITFETNSAQLTSQAKSSLDVVARALQADRLADFKFSIEGHADPRGASEDNLKLSQARAESVVAYLVERHGIGRERLRPVGKGDAELANAQRPDAPENRRVTITTLQSDAP